MKTLNHNLKPFIFWLALLLAALLIWLTSCNPQKKIQKATELVLITPEARQKVFAAQLQLSPCITDTSIKFLPGKTDTLTLTQIQKQLIDTTNRERLRDSILGNYSDICNEKIKAAFDLGIATASAEVSKIKIPYKYPDTIKYTLIDKLLLNMYIDTINSQHEQIAYLKGKSDQAATQLTEANKAADKWKLYFWLLVGAIGVGSVFTLLRKFKVV